MFPIRNWQREVSNPPFSHIPNCLSSTHSLYLYCRHSSLPNRSARLFKSPMSSFSRRMVSRTTPLSKKWTTKRCSIRKKSLATSWLSLPSGNCRKKWVETFFIALSILFVLLLRYQSHSSRKPNRAKNLNFSMYSQYGRVVAFKARL